jgi:hypothetical protein
LENHADRCRDGSPSRKYLICCDGRHIAAGRRDVVDDCDDGFRRGNFAKLAVQVITANECAARAIDPEDQRLNGIIVFKRGDCERPFLVTRNNATNI